MKSRILAVLTVLLALSFANRVLADDKAKTDKKCDTKNCTAQSMKDCKDPSQCKMDKAQCEKTMSSADCKKDESKCPMMKGTKASMKTTDGKMDCCKGKATKASMKTKKTTTTQTDNGTK
jgi:hypothetical protein